MLDVESVAACMPGGEINETVDDRTWKGMTAVRVGPVNLSFFGTVTMVERNDAEHRVVLHAEGKEQRGKGAASAHVRSQLVPNGDSTHVAIVTDLKITGAVAQFGRGMIQDVSTRLTKEFAECIGDGIRAAAHASAPPAETATSGATIATSGSSPTAAVRKPTPVKGIRLGLWALWRAIVRAVKRLFGRGDG